ncbi:MAG: type I DNA topoisomerase [Holosporales bacterium]|jgi:DNA topoisomerase-1|nr:type I DNA topoisomerase [Holosporales bacterium]
MLKGIVIVESPAKAKTLRTYLGKDYKVIASYGHIRDLVSKNGSVDTNNHYKMLWEFNERGKKQIKEISDSLKLSDNLFLATDPDREGEAISWHILETLKAKKLLANKNVKRVVFHEITKSAVERAFQTPKNLDQNLVDAYLARRALDYLVGFSLSPVLWRKMPGAKSAGRVQSVALRLIVERELEIQRFKSEEYWSIHADFDASNGTFTSSLVQFDNAKLEKLDIKNETQANDIIAQLEKKQYFVDTIEKKTVKRNPYAPFTTSTLQQEAVRKLGFSAKKAMQIAQKLYEGVSIDGTMTGLITYMRTDSTALSTEAINGSRSFIQKTYGDKYLPKSPKIYKTKTKNAQEAHEAIRPTSFLRPPDAITQFISNDELKLYELIWKRTVASQMENALIDQVSVNIPSKDKTALFKASGSTILFDGFLKLYVESTDDNSEDADKKVKKLPILKEGEDLELKSVIGSQHFTQPPPRFNEASLVKKLEELGIGRPSTYATIINVLQERKYATLQKRTFIPESIGFLVTSFLRNFFSKYVQYGFTANLEEELDDISNGRLIWDKVLDKFWEEFTKYISKANELTITDVINSVEKDINDYLFKDVENERICPLCKTGRINLKLGRFGAFLGCSNYPDCKFTKKLGESNSENMANETPDRPAKVEIGKDVNNNNDSVFLKKGPFGYYFEWENTKDSSGKKPKRQAIPKFVNNPSELTIDDAITLSSLPKVLGEHPKSKKEIQLALGKFGPYLKMGDKSFRLEKDMNFLKTTLEDALKIINEKS